MDDCDKFIEADVGLDIDLRLKFGVVAPSTLAWTASIACILAVAAAAWSEIIDMKIVSRFKSLNTYGNGSGCWHRTVDSWTDKSVGWSDRTSNA